MEKFVVPENNVAIWGYFYGLDVSQAAEYLFGVVEIAIAVCMFLGLARTAAYGAAVVLHAISVVVSWRQLIDSWGAALALLQQACEQERVDATLIHQISAFLRRLERDPAASDRVSN